MRAPLFSRREMVVAGGVGLLAASSYAVLRPQPGTSITGSGAGPAAIFEPLDDGIKRAQTIELRPGRNDLTRRAPGASPASGVPILISGRLSNGFGRPLPATRIEIWNANRSGRYIHVHDPIDLPDDPDFAGIGRTVTDSRGHFQSSRSRPARIRRRSAVRACGRRTSTLRSAAAPRAW